MKIYENPWKSIGKSLGKSMGKSATMGQPHLVEGSLSAGSVFSEGSDPGEADLGNGNGEGPVEIHRGGLTMKKRSF